MTDNTTADEIQTARALVAQSTDFDDKEDHYDYMKKLTALVPALLAEIDRLRAAGSEMLPYVGYTDVHRDHAAATNEIFSRWHDLFGADVPDAP